MAAKNSFGNTIKLVASGGSLAAVAGLLSLDPPKLTRGMQDATELNQAGQAMAAIPEGVYDAGEISGQIHYIAGSTADDLFIAGLTGGGAYDFEIVLKAASGTESITGTAYISEYGPDGQEIKGKQTAGFKLKVTGALTQGPTA